MCHYLFCNLIKPTLCLNFRCMECSSTLLPGSYKHVGDAGSLVCTHHFTRISSNSQNGRPDLSKQLSKPLSSNSSPESTPSGGGLDKASPEHSDANEHITPSDNLPRTHSLERETRHDEKGVKEIREEFEDGVKVQIEPCPPSPPNPFGEFDEELKEEEQPKPATDVTNGLLFVTSKKSTAGENRPVPAPRKVSDPSPSVRPVPRPRPRPLQSPASASGGCFRRVTVKLFFYSALIHFIFSLYVPSLPTYVAFSVF